MMVVELPPHSSAVVHLLACLSPATFMVSRSGSTFIIKCMMSEMTILTCGAVRTMSDDGADGEIGEKALVVTSVSTSC